MDQLRRLITSLSIKQRITILVAALAVCAGILSLTHWRQENDFRPLYTSLAPEDAGTIVQKLKESGVEFRLSENGSTVLAPSARVAELRLELASAGLPKSGRIGFELFDKTNFGATEFTEHVNYRRALEGELERSIMSLSEVEQARVHLTFSKDSVFVESKQPAKASVVLRLRPGAKLSAQNVSGLTNLVASAVEGLAPESVTLLDTRGNLLNRPRKVAVDDSQVSDATLEYRQKIESDLLTKINATLEPLLGAEKFRAGVSVDCDFTSGEQSEETLDPNKSVMVTSQKTEENTGASLASGTPGTASNLPRPPGRANSAGQGISRRTENIAYQSSRLIRHVRLPQGGIKRMSLSILVDNDVKWEGTNSPKRTLIPPSPERLKAIRDLVTGITGFNSERGDQLVVETLPFESTLSLAPPGRGAPELPAADPRIPRWLAPLLSNPKNMFIAAAAALGLILLIAATLFLVFRKKRRLGVQLPAELPGRKSSAITPDDQKKLLEAQLAQQADLQAQLDKETLIALNIPIATSKKSEVLVKHLRESVTKDRNATTDVLRSWLSDSGNAAT